ncbi:hypothetical protein [Vibrio nigripulchritudo]|uniref:hypothetical protein n=1 Tax=Vibrio nigripulchritudo TaxID=28173 RepID=UPI002490E8DD|nr:hypothetical protein [Vibrio nigripulchritudo]BDU41052.1 hypothetical protein TUMSATVNIG2_55210 [Vibrio nigripulchritudo]BDU46792.1 hypothetical protein TUMSATVNIG3_55900 [Vibrio nigripulchritudo]
MNDSDYVNFSQDHELNHHLKKVNKRQTQENRNELKKMGDELKKSTGKTRIKHGEFNRYIRNNLYRLD